MKETKSAFKSDIGLSPTGNEYPKLLRNEIFDKNSKDPMENVAPAVSRRLFQVS